MSAEIIDSLGNAGEATVFTIRLKSEKFDMEDARLFAQHFKIVTDFCNTPCEVTVMNGGNGVPPEHDWAFRTIQITKA